MKITSLPRLPPADSSGSKSSRFSRQRSLLRLFTAALLITGVLVCCLTPSTAWARAGGGENYGGGGGGGGGFGGGGFSGGYSGGSYPSGGSDSGGGGSGINLPPQILIPLVILVVVVIIFSSQQAQQQHVVSTIRRGRQRQSDREQQEGTQLIQIHDPGFAINAFLVRAKTAFEKIQAAWSTQDLKQVRSFISDGIFERFSLQTQMQRQAGFRNVIENVRISSATAAGIFSTQQFDTIHIRIQATATDYNLDLASNRKIPNTEHTGPFTEYWSFCRRPGTKSLQGDGTIEGHCPRCAALLKVVDQAKCDSCGAQVNSGEYDWVLTEITQESEWQVPGTETQFPGVAELSARDPSFNIEHIEDRVSVMFWRLRAAEFYHDEKYAAPVITEEYRQLLNRSLASSNRYYKDAAVGQVEMLDAQTGNDGMDQVRVMIRWSGTLMERNGSRESVLKEQTIYTQALTLIRGSNVKSNPLGTFTSAGCANCGAPISVNESGACVYCGASLTTGQFDWVLKSADRFSPEAAHVFATSQAQFQSESDRVKPQGGTELPIAILAKVMLVDGVLDDRERQALQRLASHRNMSDQQLKQILQQAQQSDADIPVPSDPEQAHSCLEQLIQAVLLDGRLSKEEVKLVNDYASRIGMTAADVSMAINRERTRAYQAARSELKR